MIIGASYDRRLSISCGLSCIDLSWIELFCPGREVLWIEAIQTIQAIQAIRIEKDFHLFISARSLISRESWKRELRREKEERNPFMRLHGRLSFVDLFVLALLICW